MRTLQNTIPAALLSALALCAAAQPAFAQDDDWQARVEETHQRYETAIAGSDIGGLAAMFAEDAVYQPLTGGLLEGRDAIRQYFEQMGFSAMEITSNHAVQVAEDMVLDYGVFSVTLPEAAGGSTVEGEYVALAELGDTVLIHSLSGFPRREGMPGQK